MISFKKKVIISTIVIALCIIGTVATQYFSLIKQADGMMLNKEYDKATTVYELVLSEFENSAVETKLSNAKNLQISAINIKTQQAEEEAIQADQTAQIQQDAQALLVSPSTQTQEPSSQNNEQIVYITNTGNKYHRAGCRYLSESEIPIEKSEAISEGYTPCSVCNP